MQRQVGPAGKSKGWPCANAAVKIGVRAAACAAKRGASRQATRKKSGRVTMPIVTWDHIHLRSPDPEATAAWLEDILGGVIVRGPGRIDVKLGGANVFIAPVTAGVGARTAAGAPLPGSLVL